MTRRLVVLAPVAAALALAGCTGQDPRYALTTYGSCDALEQAIKDQAQAEIDYRFAWRFPWQGGGIPLAAGADMAESGGVAAPVSRSFSDTNVQVEGVDEPDLVETDGTFIYALAGDHLVVTRAWPPEQAAEIARVPIEGFAKGMFLRSDGVLAVVTQLWGAPSPASVTSTRITRAAAKVSLLDVSEPADPATLRELYVEGQVEDARVIEDRLYLATYTWLTPASVSNAWDRASAADALDQTTLEAWMPQRLDGVLEGGAWSTTEGDAVACDAVYGSERRSGNAMTTLTAIDLADPKAPATGTSILGSMAALYANGRSLYVASNEEADGPWATIDPVLESVVHRFEIAGGPAVPTYVASGKIPGRVESQFSMDEKDDRLRIATTERNGESPSNGVYVLEPSGHDLRVVGKVEGIAPGETIYAVRFVGDVAYVVTFLRTDPLFTIDLADPSAPRVRGALEIPGFSNYLHPMDPTRLLAIGQDGGWGNVKISIFDVSDPDAPAVESELLLPGTGYSEAQNDHHAFNYFPEQQVLVVPVQDGSTNATRMVVVHAAPGERLAELGRVSQEVAVEASGVDAGSVDWCAGFRRSVIIEDTLYAMSNAGLTITPVQTPDTLLSTVPFTGVDVCADSRYGGMVW